MFDVLGLMFDVVDSEKKGLCMTAFAFMQQSFTYLSY